MPRVLCVCDDMIFATKIGGTASAVGCDLKVVRGPQQVSEQLDDTATTVIVDLGAAGPDPVGLIRELRERHAALRIVAYGSHVDTAVSEAARGAGADEVLPRSAFSGRLPEILSAL